ncbi:MAG: UDP-N-acetylmuramate:L-alanyl-gamma-D-glutamyl-meso-diaminopimelate ligase [Acidobacteria bacterium]|nr:MAG: UDP-N-acetylmuramate:L-alanyl-gamma-D-glutamyl-meso-diaminopimelate ligase [Acidobacteriota bacterium]PYU38994.1 MAG: UDP-N-acetylmuramate:L-alanyl-gamma-D-glutamyl-meso-diaminopimelate ligase [Acidobacteriota bacterium]PYU71504.1 MAG: UDP-N-acetylmuramate:L-alanyl-gamma-D-glutamyl-meso-diaminopimelate ligase [Acidobacteriota bacterium]
MRANSEAVRRSHHFRCASWAHRSAYAHDTPGHTGAPGCRWGRHTRIPGIGGRVLNETKHVHVIGIGGSAMAPLAGMLRERGFRVSGSDSGVYPPASTLLESLGISFFNGFDAAHLHPAPDLVVIGNIIARGNPELEEVLDRKISYRSMPEILEEFFLPERHSIVVSGTHGKTTTTAMLAWIFHTAGKRPNFLVGGVAENFGKSYGLGGGEEFILEGDEYETSFWDRGPKFFHYHPDDLIITSLEYDHADIYPDFETYQLAFRRLVNLVPRRGKLVIWGDTEESGPALQRAAEKAFCPVETYGLHGGNDWVASDLAVDGGIMRFRAAHHGTIFGEFALAATGRHNVLNAMAALIVAQGRDIPAAEIAKALGTFRSVKRRMDVRGEIGGVVVVDDFAHHPTAVKATIEAARGRWPGRRLWAILEPRSNSMRRKVFQEALPPALALGDRVVLGGVFRVQQLSGENRLDPETVAESVRALGKDARVFPSSDAIAEHLGAEARAGDVLLIMSNGSFDGLCEKLLKKLSTATQLAGEARTR